MLKVAISADFLTAFAALPRKIQGKVTEFINKFRTNPEAGGINYEKIQSSLDEKIYSVRIDDTYRGIVVRQAQQGVYLLLWVDHHDRAYAWAQHKRCEVNPKNGTIQVYDAKESAAEPVAQGLFATTPQEDLLRLGVPEALLVFTKSLRDKIALYQAQDAYPADAFEALSWLAEGFPVEEIITLLDSQREQGAITEDFKEALERPETMKNFFVVSGEEELRRIMASPLEKWRIFLHPTQRKIVQREYAGAARVLGGAGTGKTVVAMHRAQRLAQKVQNKGRILFTTFTANLAEDIKENLRKLCTVDEMRQIEVVHLDAWIGAYLQEQGYKAQIIYDAQQLTKLWEEALINAKEALGLQIAFYQEEWVKVVVAQEAFTLPLYAKAMRTGRGTALDRKKRLAVWKVMEAYLNLLKERQVRDIYYATYECMVLVRQNSPEGIYPHIIVDEGQDLSANAFKLLRQMAGEPHANDLFIVGDSHQRIYKNKTTLSKCAINVRGRSSILRINYRTTEEIRRAALALLEGVSFDDLDGASDETEKCQSLMHGSVPIVKNWKNEAEEIQYICQEIKALVSNGVALNNICLVARTHKILQHYAAVLAQNELASYEIKKSKTDNRAQAGVRLATMHRVKGLEFKYVFIVSVNKRIVPLATAINYTDKVAEQESLVAEKCLLYVAMTRAQQAVYITSFGESSEFVK